MGGPSSVPDSLTLFKNLLLTGSPGCGKTTVLEGVLEHLGNIRLADFLTLQLRENGQRPSLTDSRIGTVFPASLGAMMNVAFFVLLPSIAICAVTSGSTG